MKKIFIVIVFVIFLLRADIIYAESSASLWDLYDFSEIEEVINGAEYELDFDEVVKELSGGESQGLFMEIFSNIISRLFAEMIYNKEVVVKIILMAICLAFLNNLSLVFKNGQISETGFFAIYCMVITVLVSGFVVMSDMIVKSVELLLQFMNALIPALMLSLSCAGAYTSQGGFCQIILIGIVLVEKALLTFILPLINVYVVLMLVNSLINEDYISRFAGLIEGFVKWFTKTMLAIFVGFNVVQGMLLPAVDGAKLKGLQKVTMAVGGEIIGNVIWGMGNVIKNAIGTAAVIVVVVIVAIPIVKVMAFSAMYKFAAAIIQPVSDNRVVTAIDSVSKGAALLYKVAMFCGVMFGMTIAIMCVATNNMG